MSGTEGERVRERGFRHATKSGGPDSRILERPWRGFWLSALVTAAVIA